MQIHTLSLSLMLLPLSALARAPQDPQAIQECAQAAQLFLKLTKDAPVANTGLQNGRKLVQRRSFPSECAQAISAPQRACMIAAKSGKAWTDCLKPPKPVEVEPAKDGLCTRPAGPRGPVVVTAAEYAGRHGTQATRFSQLTKAPIEMCGAGASYKRLQALACDDGSKPLNSPMAAGGARVGNVGQGGRCKTMIDHYQVRCPEKQYDVYVDMYWCRPGMWPHY